MKTGEIVRRFAAKDGRKVVLRKVRWEDLDDLMETINSLVDEKAEITVSEKVSRDEEIDWLANLMRLVEKGKRFYLVVEVEGKVAGVAEVQADSRDCARHVGVVGIVLKKGYRDVGIGTEVMKTLIEHAPLMGLKILTLSAFATNKRAINVYRRVGFVETGRVPKKFLREGQYVDEVIMAKTLE